MKKVSVILSFLLAAGLWAADFWQSKPFTEWSAKDVARMLTDSPWAHRVSQGAPTSLADAAAPPAPTRSGGGETTAGAAEGSSGISGGRGAQDREASGNAAASQTVTLIVRWQTALPVKQALADSKYGAEAATSPEAKKFLERPEPDYVISVSVLPTNLSGGDMEKLKKAAKEQTFLNVKGRAPVAPMDVQFLPAQQPVDAFFLFPRSAAITLDDKDVEFTTSIGNLTVKYRFRLKDMVYKGKLEL